MSDIIIAPAALEDFLELRGKEPPITCRAWSVFYKGKLAGIGGVTISRHNLLFFSDMREGEKYPAAAIYRTACYVVNEVAKMGKTVMAVGDAKSHNFLTRLGFIHMGAYEGQELYQLWRQ